MTEAEIQGLINSIGTAQATIKADPGSPLDELLVAMMQEVTDKLLTSLDGYDALASGNLRQSIIPTDQAYLDGDVLTVNIQAPNYWKFVNYGVNGTEKSWSAPAWGTQPPSDVSFHTSIMNWVRNKGITAPEQFSSYESFAWAIMTNLRKYGQQPKPFYSDVVNEQLYSYLSDQISTLIGRAISVQITEPYK